jgi:hypothetical protein
MAYIRPEMLNHAMGSNFLNILLFFKKIFQFLILIFMILNFFFEFRTPFFKKSYLSLSTDYTYKFLVPPA